MSKITWGDRHVPKNQCVISFLCVLPVSCHAWDYSRDVGQLFALTQPEPNSGPFEFRIVPVTQEHRNMGTRSEVENLANDRRTLFERDCIRQTTIHTSNINVLPKSKQRLMYKFKRTGPGATIELYQRGAENRESHRLQNQRATIPCSSTRLSRPVSERKSPTI